MDLGQMSKADLIQEILNLKDRIFQKNQTILKLDRMNGELSAEIKRLNELLEGEDESI
jgi:hypothetical protein